jgi:hypothetical protein
MWESTWVVINNVHTVSQGFFGFLLLLSRVEVVTTGGLSARKIPIFENSAFGNNQSQT